ncbi:unnamed protein product, partial [Scytosiphon promiscuus]
FRCVHEVHGQPRRVCTGSMEGEWVLEESSYALVASYRYNRREHPFFPSFFRVETVAGDKVVRVAMEGGTECAVGFGFPRTRKSEALIWRVKFRVRRRAEDKQLGARYAVIRGTIEGGTFGGGHGEPVPWERERVGLSVVDSWRTP